MSVEVLYGTKQAADAVRHELQIDTCPPSESRFEILRSTVWGMAAPRSKAHVNRILGTALPTWRLLSERTAASDETFRAELREALSTLGDTGDLVELGGGYWAPATTRFVELPRGTGYLLVGGVPTALLQIDPCAAQHHGPHRYFTKRPLELAAALPIEDHASWARLPADPLQEWAREILQSLERQPYSPPSTDAFEFYVPARSTPGTPQFRRWFESVGNASGTLLARRARLYGAREYRLVDVHYGRIVSACDLQDIDVRRLMYALDLDAKNPVRARLRLGPPPEWLFTSELPRAEQRMFAAFGTLTIPDNRPFERRWTIIRNESLVLDMLRSLGIALGQ